MCGAPNCLDPLIGMPLIFVDPYHVEKAKRTFLTLHCSADEWYKGFHKAMFPNRDS